MSGLVKNWKKYLNELIDPDEVDVSSFEAKTHLNDDLWENESLFKPEVADRLYAIAQDFFKSLSLDWVELKDITLTGSLANYTWSKYSDIDLHLIVSFREVDENLDLVSEYLRDAGSLWNKQHDIKIKGWPVEVYVQDFNEPHHSTGVYSIINDVWIQRPMKTFQKIDYTNIQKKAALLMQDIDEIYDMYTNKEYKNALESADKLRDKIRRFRGAGLETGGAYSVENLTFKVLRRNEYLKKLSSLRILSYDNLMSLNGNN
jgi:predicted nucleotidyltransferase